MDSSPPLPIVPTSPATTQLTKQTFDTLRGESRLDAVVSELNKSCPWTLSLTPQKMTTFLKSECGELQRELNRPHSSNDSSNELPPNLTSIKSEVGDILFDALMLNTICSRHYSYSPSECFDVASAKVERRTSYMLWGDGEGGETVDDCERIWREGKREENLTENARKSDRKRSLSNTASDFFEIIEQISTLIQNYFLITERELGLMLKTGVVTAVGTWATCHMMGRRGEARRGETVFLY